MLEYAHVHYFVLSVPNISKLWAYYCFSGSALALENAIRIVGGIGAALVDVKNVPQLAFNVNWRSVFAM